MRVPACEAAAMPWKSGIYHNPSGIYFEDSVLPLGSDCTLRLRVPSGAPVQMVYLRCAPDGEQQMLKAERTPRVDGWDCDWWEVRLQLHNQRFNYRFFLLTDNGGWWYTAAGVVRTVPTDHTDFVLLADYHAPHWVERSVFYQIFPDRFDDGDPSNNVRSGGHFVDGKPAVARKWGELPNIHQGGREFYGGDLQGITRRLDYLRERLGVNAIYLNPIGTAPSSHKYDVGSYTEVDLHFGGEKAFLELKRGLDERGMRVILDIVPNHCGSEHPWFQAALKDPQAETAEFFTFRKHPHEYESWLGIRSLPKLNYNSEKLRDWMYRADDSVMRSWLKPPYEIDGWRVDVANMLARSGAHQLGHKILRGMRRAIKSENSQCYFLGENFFDASPHLQGDELDATMNYRGFMMPLYHWLTGRDYNAVFEREYADRYPLSSYDLEQQWRAFRSTVPWLITRQQFNLLDSHDTPRLLTLVDGDRRKAAVARLLLFTYPGVPCVYYGDELALEGHRDPDNRRTMNWDEESWDQDWLQAWSQLIRLRTESPALARGSFQVLTQEGNTLAFVRESRQQRLLVVARRAHCSLVDKVRLQDAAVPNRTRFRELFSGRIETVQDGFIAIPPDWTQLWEEL